MPDGAIYVGRPSRWGNPFEVGRFGRERSIALFRNALTGYWTPSLFTDDEPDDLVGDAYRTFHWMREARRRSDIARLDLRGQDLACWCPLDQPCHADVLLELANR